jgi:hypothetical protein
MKKAVATLGALVIAGAGLAVIPTTSASASVGCVSPTEYSNLYVGEKIHTANYRMGTKGDLYKVKPNYYVKTYNDCRGSNHGVMIFWDYSNRLISKGKW